METTSQKIIWSPQPGPQTALLECPVFEVFYGGARGGGKTESSIGDWLQHSSMYGEHAIGIFFRRKLIQLAEVIARTKQLFPKLGAKYNEQKKEWLMANGARLKFAYLERDSDAEEYQGHNYCVAVGTPVLMADGSWKPIEEILPGQQVMTLQGPQTVLSKVEPYLAPCVQAQVRSSSGEVLVSQIHPIWHPIASTAALSGLHTDAIHQSGLQSQPLESAQHKSFEEFHLYSDPKTPGWLSWSKGDYNDYKEFEDELQELPPLPESSFLAVLHKPSFQKVLESSSSFCEAKQSFPDQVFAQGLSGKFQEKLQESQDAVQSHEHEQLALGHDFPYFSSGQSCVQNGFQSIQGFSDCCRFLYDSCDEHAPVLKETFLRILPLQDDVEKQLHGLRLGASDTIPLYTQTQPLCLVHPYTGEVQDLSEQVVVEQVFLQPLGYSFVSDIEVEHSNHYITFGGFVNKNTRVYVEEVTNFPSPSPINKLRATLRSAAGVPVGMRLTGNPGGPGHNWVKKRYITPDPRGFKVISEECTFSTEDGPQTVSLSYVFIPSKIGDNQLLMKNDPTYILRLRQSGSEALVKAWLEGNWDIVDGAFFDEWDETKHILDTNSWLPRFPLHATRFRAMDWGSAKPFSVGWYIVSDGTWGLPKNALIKYREWYGASGPNKGLKMTADLVARGILEREKGERINYGVADPAIFIRDGGPSIGETMAVVGCSWRRADNKRKAGAEKLRQLLAGETGVPLIYFLDCCEDTIRTLPVLQHDETDPEDVDTESEDHAYDETRYAAMSRPYMTSRPQIPVITLPRMPHQMTINELIEMKKRKRLREMEL